MITLSLWESKYFPGMMHDVKIGADARNAFHASAISESQASSVVICREGIQKSSGRRQSSVSLRTVLKSLVRSVHDGVYELPDGALVD